MKRDFIIVGQGIAGSVLAFLLREKGLSVMVWDDGYVGSSSMTAGGMWNPIAFRKLTLNWMADELLVAANQIYREMEKKTGENFYHPVSLARIFPDAGSANLWDTRTTHPKVRAYLTDQQNESIQKEWLQPWGHGVVTGTGWMNIPVMLRSIRDWLKKEDALREEKFDYDRLSLSESAVHYDGITADYMVCCTGIRNRENPLFKTLAVVPNKGETLTVKLEDFHGDAVVHFGHFLIPLGDQLFRLGSTYQLHVDDDIPSAAARTEMLNELKKVYRGKIEVVQHLAGVRPTSITRKPYLGVHPKYKPVVCFNGLGSRGVLTAPWSASHLCDHLLLGKKLMRDFRFERYLK